MDYLKNAIQRLPQYDPPAQVWDRIQSDLEVGALIEEDLQRLPEYEPPDLIWDNIAAALTTPQPVVPKRAFLRPRLSWAAAAAVLLLVSLSWFRYQSGNNDQALVRYQFSTMEPVAQSIENTLEADESAFLWAMRLCEEYPFLCENQTFVRLQEELLALNEAKNELMEAMGLYGENSMILQQLRQLEDERSYIVKQIVQLI